MKSKAQIHEMLHPIHMGMDPDDLDPAEILNYTLEGVAAVLWWSAASQNAKTTELLHIALALKAVTGAYNGAQTLDVEGLVDYLDPTAY